MPAAVAPATSTDAYRRAARRLRWRLAGDPARLQRSLKALADRPPITATSDEPSASILHAPAGAARRFADHLTAHAPTGVLRYSQRLALLRAANRFGIDRFEANLLIAAVVDRRRRQVPLASSPEGRVALRGVLLGNLLTFLLVQSALALGAWWMLLR